MIRRTKRANADFNMSSMTDVVFLLLIFFMATSTLINPNALKLLLPKSTNQTSNTPAAVVSIDRRLTFYLNQKVTPFSQLESRLVALLQELALQYAPLRGLDLVDHLVRLDLVERLPRFHGLALLLQPRA